MPKVSVGNPALNAEEIIKAARELASEAVAVAVFPELSVTGYTCADLFGEQFLADRSEAAVEDIVKASASLDCLLVVGTPVRYAGRLFNCAAVIARGKLLGLVPKTYLPGNGEFYEPRWFESARVLPAEGVHLSYAGAKDVLMGVHQLFRVGKALVGVEICQDLWSPVPPSTWAALAGAQIIVNLSASNEILLKHEYRRQLVQATSSRLFAAYVYCSCGYGESTQDLVWAGSSLIAEYGSILSEAKRFELGGTSIISDIDIEKLDTLRVKEHHFGFEGDKPKFAIVQTGVEALTDYGKLELRRYVEPHPFVPQGDKEALGERCREILATQVAGLVTRLDHIHCRRAVIGISGGLDSTLALLVTVLAFDKLGIPRKNILSVTMPGFGTTGRTYNNACTLCRELGTELREISIVPAVREHFANLGHDENIHDLTYENSQARERTQILMDLAGKVGGIVIGTGDLSELALGWCTYNGDHMSMYGVNVSVPKTLVKTLVCWASDRHFSDSETLRTTLRDIVDTPISPELLPKAEDGSIAQITEDVVGPYELHDFFLYHFFRFGYDPEKIYFLAKTAFGGTYPDQVIKKWLQVFLKRFYTQQFKRSCLPDGPKVGSVSLSPRGDWRMPSDIASPFKFE